MRNILSIDLESWVHFYSEAINEQRKTTSSERKLLDNNYTPQAVEKILALLEKHKQKATFFVVGELYEWYPETIEKIHDSGHEIAYHTHTHSLLKNGKILENELKQSRSFLKKFRPIGFRAPQIFITRDSMACLKKWGFKYSSSTYDSYNVTNIEGIDEIPVSVLPFRSTTKSSELPKNLTIGALSKMIPFGSGLFISILGSKVSYFINRLNKKHTPAILFIHPWQLYQHEKIKGLGFKLKVAMKRPLCVPYSICILKSMEKLLQRYRFVSFRECYYDEK